MLFNSTNFALFLPAVFLLYWFVFSKTHKSQNLLLLVSSYFFYACWDYRFLFLLVFSTALDFYTGLKMQKSSNETVRKTWFWISVLINVGFLGTFKYFNFFAESFSVLLEGMGFQANISTLKVILPVGISFYTFHGLSYVIDVYKKRINPENNFVDYAVFVSFFPLLVAGPIERATHLLPQIKQKRVFDYTKAILGLRQILWGLVKKIVIADTCAGIANTIFNDTTNNFSGLAMLLGAVMFTFQIYGDFSGYSDIALGTARLFGVDLLKNFAYPYFSRDIAEFWRRWHISLSSWFRDYLYFPMGGSKVSQTKQIRNTLTIFIVSGFWHGANWTFIVWGLLNAIFILPSIIFKTNRNNIAIVAKGKLFPSISETLSMFSTFLMTVFAWIFFRSETVGSAYIFIKKLLTGFFNKQVLISSIDFMKADIGYPFIVILCLFFLIEWLGREQDFALEKLQLKTPYRWTFYVILTLFIFYFAGSEQQFIYFQF